MNDLTLNEVLFQKLRIIDVELAEDLYRRMPIVATVTGLNVFIHSILGQYKIDTLHLRMALKGNDFTEWYTAFEAVVVPFLTEHRLPPMTNHTTPATYCENLIELMQSAQA